MKNDNNKKVNLDEIDESFIISSFKDKRRLENPSSDPIPITPPEKEKENKEDVVKDTPREENRRKRSKTPDFESLFLQEAEISTRDGKLVSIREEYHTRITKIVRVITGNKVSIFSYIDNVLAHHFDVHQDEIQALYDQREGKLF